jgi:hypothetical protein
MLKLILKILAFALTSLILVLTLSLAFIYTFTTPSNDRNWTADQQVLAKAEFLENDLIRIDNIRSFRYSSINEYESNYFSKTYNLNQLETVDYIVVPLGQKGAAHTFLSFGFANEGSGEIDTYLPISVEIRKREGQKFSPIKGIFNRYEIMYVIADEKDLIDLRARHRENQLYLYPVQTTKDKVRELFVDMLVKNNQLHTEPEFYNTITNNCTTNIVDHINKISPKKVPSDIRTIFPENSDKLAYEIGLIDNSLPFEEIRVKYNITEKAVRYFNSPDYSILIRNL